MLPGKKYKLLDFAHMAWRRRWVIVLPMVVGAYVGLVVSSRMKDIFQSEMLIQVVPQRVPDSYVRSTVTMRTEDRLNSLAQQVMSRPELEKLIVGMNLYESARDRVPMQDVVNAMRSDISMQIVRSQRDNRDADSFYIRFAYPDRDLAAQVTDRIGALFVDVNARDRGNLADATNEFLQSQLVEARQRLEETEGRLEQFRERNAGRLPTQLDSNLQAIRSTEMELQALVESTARDRDRKLMLERLYNDAQIETASPSQAPAPAPVSGDGPTGLTSAQQLAAAREQLARLELRLKPEHPDIARAKRQIAELEARMADEVRSGGTGVAAPRPLTPDQTARRDRAQEMRAQIESLDRQIEFKEGQQNALRTKAADYQRRIEQVPGVESEWVALSRDYDTQQKAYKDLLAKSEESNVAAELEKRQVGEQFRVLDPARPASRPTGIPRLQVNAIAAAIGLALGLLIAAALELFDPTFKSVEDVLDVLKLPVVAAVPYVMSTDDRRRQRMQRQFTAAAVMIALLVGGYGFWDMQLWKHLR